MRKILLALVMAMGTQGVAAEDAAKPAEWLFVHTAQTAEMTSATTLIMPVTRDIFAFTDRPNRMHGYMNAHEFVTLWDEGEGDTFKADPPNAVLTWVDGDEMKEAELLILSAETVSHGRGISYEVKLEAGDVVNINLATPSVFVDSSDVCAWPPGGKCHKVNKGITWCPCNPMPCPQPKQCLPGGRG